LLMAQEQHSPQRYLMYTAGFSASLLIACASFSAWKMKAEKSHRTQLTLPGMLI